MENTKTEPKIPTGISGLDELFYGGFRLPNPNGKKGICIAIYGNRGISKMDIALQMMYGMSTESHSNCRYYDINRKMRDMQTRYNGLHMGRVIQEIRQPQPYKMPKCELCKHFNLPNLNESKDGHISIEGMGYNWQVNEKFMVYCCGNDKYQGEKFCDLCKMIRHEIVNYNDRTNSLHWTVGNRSDESNTFANIKPERADDFFNIFDCQNLDDKTPIQKYNCIFQEIKKLPHKDFFDSIVVGGFTAIGEGLEKLPYNALMELLRDKSRVSILVFDERGKDLHLNADIIIEMRVREDEQTHYIHHELRVAKSDLQRHVYGWHHYKKLRDLSIEVFPNIHALMSHRFASTYALARLERDSFKFPQTLLQKFQDGISSISKEDRNNNNKHFKDVVKKIKGAPFSEEKKSHLTIDVKNQIDTSTFIQNSENGTILVLLFGRDEIAFYDTVQNEANKLNKSDNKSHIHCWSVRPSDILPEEILGIIKQFVRRWWNRTTKKSTLHIYLDDIAQFWLYPLLEKERNFLPALFSICNEVRYDREFDKPLVIHDVKLHLICSLEKCLQYKYVEQLINWNN